MILLKFSPLLNTVPHRLLSTIKLPTLYETLKVIEISPDVFIQPAETLFVYPYRTSVFGGQIIGSAIYAAQLTLTRNQPLHSLHSYFLSAADNSSAITYKVKRLREGHSFQARSVTALQDNKIVFECEMSFHKKEKGNLAHQPIMPNVGLVPPEKLHSTRERFRSLLDDSRLPAEFRPFVALALTMPMRIDIRHCHPRDLLTPAPEWPARQLVWIKAVEPLPNDSHLHRSAVAYCSDRVLLTSALLPYAVNIFSPRIKMQVSLDHSMWFHDDFGFETASEIDEATLDDDSTPIERTTAIPTIPPKSPVRADDWLLYELECPVAMNNRALTFGRIWTKCGRLIVTCAQEGAIRCY
ncbi:unnamed protein product [Rotaria magnacalcarata]|uniref:Acyl-CoA thioesterase II n=2 Tax=Rotaria magnacalcarata TaxID=392030 RepID=A0A819DQB5_9BILA|nr:unnamed protein product [Rotaria magnacalcarata]CAF3834759.1 unnamed protein product [Rotaria magnacalcarata]